LVSPKHQSYSMAIKPVPQRTLTDVVGNKITRLILDGTTEPGIQLSI
jgi:DNA-binding GntR family transcriptional regulator